MSNKRPLPWAHLDEYRGKDFTGEWPTFPELLAIQVKRFGDRPCFTDFDGPNDSKRTINYSQMYLKKVTMLQLQERTLLNGPFLILQSFVQVVL